MKKWWNFIIFAALKNDETLLFLLASKNDEILSFWLPPTQADLCWLLHAAGTNCGAEPPAPGQQHLTRPASQLIRRKIEKWKANSSTDLCCSILLIEMRKWWNFYHFCCIEKWWNLSFLLPWKNDEILSLIHVRYGASESNCVDAEPHHRVHETHRSPCSLFRSPSLIIKAAVVLWSNQSSLSRVFFVISVDSCRVR